MQSVTQDTNNDANATQQIMPNRTKNGNSHSHTPEQM